MVIRPAGRGAKRLHPGAPPQARLRAVSFVLSWPRITRALFRLLLQLSIAGRWLVVNRADSPPGRQRGRARRQRRVIPRTHGSCRTTGFVYYHPLLRGRSCLHLH